MTRNQQTGKRKPGTPGAFSRWMQQKANGRMIRKVRASIELAGRAPLAVTPRSLAGTDRAQAWSRITDANPRMAKYQNRSEREYPIIRLTPR